MTASSLIAWPLDGGARFCARQFAQGAGDLDIDFADAMRAALVTALLGSCLRTLDGQRMQADTLWQWTVAERLQGLLAIARAANGAITSALASCSAAGCGTQIELDLALDGFAGSAPAAVAWRAGDGVEVECRLPTGDDLRAWHVHTQHDGPDEPWFARRLITRVGQAPPAAGWRFPRSWLAPLGQVLEAADPLTALTIDVACPACSRQLAVEIDLESLLLEGLRRRQCALLEEVHQLASAYHWAENAIVALPAWRRAGYLSRIGVALS